MKLPRSLPALWHKRQSEVSHCPCNAPPSHSHIFCLQKISILTVHAGISAYRSKNKSRAQTEKYANWQYVYLKESFGLSADVAFSFLQATVVAELAVTCCGVLSNYNTLAKNVLVKTKWWKGKCCESRSSKACKSQQGSASPVVATSVALHQ